MAKKKPPADEQGWRKVEMVSPGFQFPTWGQVQKMAESVIRVMGGHSGAASKLDGEAYYCLCILHALMLDKEKAEAPILGAKVVR